MATVEAVATMPDMGRQRGQKKADKPDEQPDGAKGKVKRIGVNFTTDWHAVLRKLAAKRKMPVVWYLIDLAREDAEKNGVDIPPLPWDEEAEGG